MVPDKHLGRVESADHLPADDLTRSLEWEMRRFVIVLRTLGWFWMLLLVATTLAWDDGANKLITAAAMVLATVWTGVTWWAARHRSRISSMAFLFADGAVSLMIGAASYFAGAHDLFHGGYPISWLVVLAYGRGMTGALLGSVALLVQQTILLLQMGRSPVSAVGSIVFVLYAVIFGLLFGMIRRSDENRRMTASELNAEREAHGRKLERLELANRLHDSALQTLQVIDTDAEDADRVRALARRQTRELRTLIDAYSTDDEATLRGELVRAAGRVEDLFNVDISTVIRIDIAMDDTLQALVDAASEAMTNAAKYSGTSRVDLYAALEDGIVVIYVRDEGRGFDVHTTRMGHGIERSIRGRIRDAGGEVHIESTPGKGTEVRLSASPEIVPV